MPKTYEVESLNYTDTSRLIEAFKDYIYNGHANKYNLDLLLKLERNKRVLYDEPSPEYGEVCQYVHSPEATESTESA